MKLNAKSNAPNKTRMNIQSHRSHSSLSWQIGINSAVQKNHPTHLLSKHRLRTIDVNQEVTEAC